MSDHVEAVQRERFERVLHLVAQLDDATARGEAAPEAARFLSSTRRSAFLLRPRPPTR